MKRAFLIALVLLTAGAIASCTTPTGETDASSYDPFADREKQTGEKTVGLGINSYDREVAFDGGRATFHVNLTAGGNDCDYGFLLFVEGVSTPFRLDGSEEATMHALFLEDKETRTLTFDFVPPVGEQGDDLTVDLLLTPWLDRVPSFTTGDSSFGFADKSDKLSASLTMNAPAPNQPAETAAEVAPRPLTDEDRALLRLGEGAYTQAEYDYAVAQQSLPEEERDPSARLRQNAFFGYGETMWVSHFEQEKSEPLTYTFALIGPFDYTYRVTFFVDHKPVRSLEGNDAILLTGGMERICTLTQSYVLSGYDGTAVVYAVAVPVTETENEYATPFCLKSNMLGVILQ